MTAIRITKDAHMVESGAAEQRNADQVTRLFDFIAEGTDTESLDRAM